MSRDRSNIPPAWRRRTERQPPLKLLVGCLAVFTLTVGCGVAWPHVQPRLGPPTSSAQTQVVRVIDGDTFVIASGEHVRILNIDTAEMPQRSQCEREADLARQARARLQTLLNAGEVELIRRGRDRDRYDRLLRLVRVGPRDVGEVLVGEGLAQRWQGHKAEWCGGLSSGAR